LPIADCRLSIEKVVWQLFPLSIRNRKSAIPAILGEAMMAEILRKKRRSLQLMLPGDHSGRHRTEIHVRQQAL
jgi:hypothetical protein